MTKKPKHVNKERTDNSVADDIKGNAWRNNGEAEKQTDTGKKQKTTNS